MNRIKTGDIVRAFKLIWPHVTGDMVRKAEQDNKIKAIRSPFSERAGLFYEPESIQAFMEEQVGRHEITQEQAMTVLSALGINFRQLRLIRPVAL
jgi:hypothetical protein